MEDRSRIAFVVVRAHLTVLAFLGLLVWVTHLFDPTHGAFILAGMYGAFAALAFKVHVVVSTILVASFARSGKDVFLTHILAAVLGGSGLILFFLVGAG